MYFLIMKESTCSRRNQIFHMNIPIFTMYIYLNLQIAAIKLVYNVEKFIIKIYEHINISSFFSVFIPIFFSPTLLILCFEN